MTVSAVVVVAVVVACAQSKRATAQPPRLLRALARGARHLFSHSLARRTIGSMLIDVLVTLAWGVVLVEARRRGQITTRRVGRGGLIS